MSEKRIVYIITINDFTNYGNRLQNYALTQLLEEKGFEIKNGLEIYNKEEWAEASLTSLRRFLKRIMPMFVFKKRIANSLAIDVASREKRDKFVRFTESYTHIEQPIFAKNLKHGCDLVSKLNADFFVVGSDQVWNPYFAGGDSFFLRYVPSKKRLSFAASIGVSDIPEQKKEFYRKSLLGMKYISVREKTAVEIVKNLCGRKADLTYDPTLLLGNEKWEKIMKKPGFNLPKEYICTYFLGDTPKDVYAFSRIVGFEIIQLNNRKNKPLFDLDPAEFLYIINKSKIVITDSFHATVFAIKFHKDFYVYRRNQDNVKDMFGRLESLLLPFGLIDRVVSEDGIALMTKVSREKWDSIDLTLRNARENALSLLLENMR